MHNQEIPIVNLQTQLPENTQQYSKSILANEIKGIQVEHQAITGENAIIDSSKEGYKTIYLFVKGTGNVVAANTNYEIIPESILLPNIVKSIAP